METRDCGLELMFSNHSAHQLAVSIMEFPYTVAKNVKMKEEDPSLRI
jgi:hypothetical protein